ncbi:hypothetical protein C6501_08990 [Candidatus Poribacteria bacterium]|nr:MAG: hypothetical protein C6501_08990 [Candidatus Poribacteria bacterium]
MKKALLFTILIFLGIVSILVVLNIVPRQELPDLDFFPDDSPQWHLPDSAKVRLGKGELMT